MNRTYRFPYRLQRKPLEIQLGRPDSKSKLLLMGLFSAHHAAHEHTSEFGDEIFGQTAKLDDFGRMIIDQELHVGKLQIVTDELILTLNTAKAREEWELIEKSITSIFCLEIKD